MPIVLDDQEWQLLDDIPAVEDLMVLLNQMLERLQTRQEFECSVRLVDETESADLNERYRGKTGPTNVLSFPYEPMAEVETSLVGDLIICAPLVVREASEQKKSTRSHFTHLVIHGVLHLLGFDHQTDEQAQEMEQIEIDTMKLAGFSNPYEAIDQL